MSFLKNLFGKREDKAALLITTCEDIRQFVEGSKSFATCHKIDDNDNMILFFIIGALTRIAEKRKLEVRDTAMMFFTNYLNINEESIHALLTRLQQLSVERGALILTMAGSNAIDRWLAEDKSSSALSELSKELDWAIQNQNTELYQQRLVPSA